MAFEKEHELCAEYCYEANSDLEIWCISNNISTGYIRMSDYFTENLDGKNGGRVELPWKFLKSESRCWMERFKHQILFELHNL